VTRREFTPRSAALRKHFDLVRVEEPNAGFAAFAGTGRVRRMRACALAKGLKMAKCIAQSRIVPIIGAA
jgi:hypothetical protein